MQFGGNKHYYQRFNTTPVAWGAAQGKCKELGAHLATITTAEEADFLQSIYDSSPASYWVGGAYDIPGEQLTWVTGEKSVYVLSVGGSGANNNVHYYPGDRWTGAGHYYGDPTSALNYVCEWSNHNYTGVAEVPDLNGNGVPETAALYVDYVTGKHTVKIRDPKTEKVVNTLTFKTSFTQLPSGPLVFKDTNGNGVPDIGVLYTDLGRPTVGIKDAKNDKVLLKTIPFLDRTFAAKEVNVTADTNGNGAPEITVLGTSKIKSIAKAETRDSKTGALLRDVVYK